jgi:hypothetical protein
MQFWEWALFHTRNILWRDEACFTRKILFKVHNIHLWASDNPHDIRECGYQARFNVSDGTGIIGDNVAGRICSSQTDYSRYRDFLQNALSGLLENVLLAVRQRLWLEHDGAPEAHYGEDVWQWLKVSSRKVYWAWRTDCMASSVAVSNYYGYFPAVTLEGVCLFSPS